PRRGRDPRLRPVPELLDARLRLHAAAPEAGGPRRRCARRGAAMNTRLLVIGYGNELRCDDGVGPRAARAVAAWQLPGVAAVAAHQLTPELAERIGAAERVVFVDAGPGDVVLTRSIEPGRAALVLGHTGEPRELLALAEALYGRRPEAWLI